MENAQLIVLALGIVAHAWRSRHAVSVFEQRLFAALCLLSLAICYREADLQSLLPLDSALRSALHIAKPVVTPPLWLAAAIVLGRCLGADWRRTRSFLSSDVALLVGGCAVMMVLAVLLDKSVCLLYTSDAADERSSVDLGGRRIIKKKKTRRAIQRRIRIQIKKRSNTEVT